MEMLKHEGLGRIVVGALLVAGAALGVAWLLPEVIAESGDPVALTTAEAQAQRRPGDELASVRLVDLELDCDEAVAIGETWYAPGRGVDSEALILLPHDDDKDCAAAAIARSGQLAEASPALRRGLRALGVDVREILVLDPVAIKVTLVGLVLFLLLAGVGGLLIRSGVRWRRELRALIHGRDPAADGGDVVEPVRSLLPRPLRVDEVWLARLRRKAITGGIIGGAFLLGGLTWGGSAAIEAAQMSHLWAHGEVASDVQVEGAEHSKALVFHGATLVIGYRDRSGALHRGSYRRFAFGFGLERRAPTVVRYDPDQPSAYALNWLVDGLWGELAIVLPLAGLLVAIGVGILRRTREGLARPSQIRSLLLGDPEEVILTVRAARRLEHKGERIADTYELALADGTTITETVCDPEWLFFLDIESTLTLGLRRRGDSDLVVVLRDDLRPLRCATEEAARVRARFRQAIGRSPEVPRRRAPRARPGQAGRDREAPGS